MRVLVLQNDKTETLGLYVKYLIDEKIEHQIFHAYANGSESEFPEPTKFDAFIVGPTPISANFYNRYLFLKKEWEVIGEIIRSGKPCLGICCGGQMLAKKLGARVVKSPNKEVGVYEVQLTERGKNDILFKGFPPKFSVFQWHSDMFEIPPKGNLLVKGDICPVQAFGFERVKGVIFHLEIDSNEVSRWADAYPSELISVGKTKMQVIQECKDNEPEMRKLAYLLIRNFLSTV
jgi:GMP synthase-like glutamine amidotransferase